MSTKKPPGTPPAASPPEGSGCGDLEWMVGPMVDGELPPAEVEEVERHIAGCSSCSRLARDFRSLEKLSRRVEEPPPVGAADWARVWEAVTKEPIALPLPGRRGVLEWAVPILSLAALALLGTWIAFALMKEPPQLPQGAHKVLEPPAAQSAPTSPAPDAERPREKG